MIPNDRLLSISDRQVSVLDAFKAADQVLLSGVQGITDLITTPGLINLDFADVKSVMSGAGSALMGIGSARGDDRAVAAAEKAISSPLLEASIDGAHGVLLSIQGGSDLGLFEIHEAAQLVSSSAALDANIIFGAVIDDALGDEVRVTVIAAGFDECDAGRAEASERGRLRRGVGLRPQVRRAAGGRSRRRTAHAPAAGSAPTGAEPESATPPSRAPRTRRQRGQGGGREATDARRPAAANGHADADSAGTGSSQPPAAEAGSAEPGAVCRRRARAASRRFRGSGCGRALAPARAGRARERARAGCRTPRAPGALRGLRGRRRSRRARLPQVSTKPRGRRR